ncbi:MAG: biotin/lipoyl-containing protein [Chthonomonadales bacterium]
MAEFGFEIEDIARLIALTETHDLAELELEDGDTKVVIRGSSYRHKNSGPTHLIAAATDHPMKAIAPPPGRPSSNGARAIAEPPSNRIALTSPMVGVFYRAPGPDSPNFVVVGDQVEIGQTVGMIEAMKVFSEIPSEFAGKVIELPAQNNQLVRTGEPLIYLTPN